MTYARCDFPETEHPGFPCAHPAHDPSLDDPEPRAITCGECGRGHYRVEHTFQPISHTATPARVEIVSTTAACDHCGHVVHIALDIESNLDPGERLTITDTFTLATVEQEEN